MKARIAIGCSLGFAVVFVLITLGCGGKGGTAGKPEREVGSVKVDKSGSALLSAHLPALVQPDEGYVMGGKRDPFRPPASFFFPAGPEPKPPPVPSLCEISTPPTLIDRLDLKLEAIVQLEGQGAAARAVLAGPQGRGFIVGEGDLVTTDCATITRILPDRILLAVPRRNQSGGIEVLEDMIPLRYAESGPEDAAVETH